MSVLLQIADLLLAASLVALAWSSLRSPDLFSGCIRFVAFGLLMALAWARLRAPDVALAEAAIGSGLMGALLLAALRRLRVSAWERREAPDEPAGGSP